MAFVLRLLTLVLTLSFTPLASATPTDSEPVRAPKSQEKRYLDYRPTLVLTDAAALGLFATALAWGDGPQTEIAYAGAGVYVLGGPTVHLAHGQPKQSIVSLVMRAGLPAAAGAFGFTVGVIACSTTMHHGLGCLAYAVPYGAVGVVGAGIAAMVVDDGFLGRVPIEDRRSARKATRAGIASIVPVFDPTRKALGLSVVGGF